nr:hypothetical protein [Streptomyces sp. st77]
MLERGEPGDVFVADLVAFGLELFQAASMYFVAPGTMALRTSPSAPS